VKLLFDSNLSHRLAQALASLYPGSAHVRDFNFARAGDEAVWDLARDEGFTIVSKDSDFHQRSLLHGFPPKVQRPGNAGRNLSRRFWSGARHVPP
jgi:predicted nuclease of predicted toxin-antitoxin system